MIHIMTIIIIIINTCHVACWSAVALAVANAMAKVMVMAMYVCTVYTVCTDSTYLWILCSYKQANRSANILVVHTADD